MTGDSMKTGKPRRAYHWRVQGRVQGVSYRWFTQQTAEALGVDGWVRNRENGDVDVEAAGPAPVLDQLRERLHDGPALARVDSLLETEIDPDTIAVGHFEIRR